ncbi:DUF456 domain-containing protein [Lysobacter brunescens]|uniref:DUF456 domain-containing protein n=1 Tax=Lysobacter brunescens TaxID=262323 RepID=A0ABW2YHB3_9GAMM
MDLSTLWYVLAGVLIVVGLLGIVLPALPGLPLVYAGMLIAAWNNGFEAIGVWTLVALGVMTLFSFAIDIFSTAIGAKRVGASRKAIVGAVLGTLGGLFFMPIGLFVGPFIGALAGELIHLRRLDRDGFGQATKVGVATWMGIVLGVALKMALAFAMLALFVLAWYF